MRTHPQMADNTCFFQTAGVGNKLPFHDTAVIRRLIHVMNHTEIDVIGLHPHQQIVKSLPDLLHISAADILTILPG